MRRAALGKSLSLLLGSAFALTAGLMMAEEPAPSGGKESATGQRVEVHTQDGVSRITLNGVTILETRFPKDGPKSYVSVLTTPQGVNVLRDSAPDHVHHHALMFAVGVDGVDYWGEGPDCGRQVPAGRVECRAESHDGLLHATFKQSLLWQDAKNSPQIQEQRELTLLRSARHPQVSLLVWQGKVEVAPGREQVELWGRSYFGLGVRFVQSRDQGGTFFNASGGKGVAGTNDQRAAWCAYTGQVNDHPVTIVIFDHPANPRSPATWFTMDQPFVYMTATLNLSKEKLTLKAGTPLTLKYGVAVCDGHLTPDQIDSLFKAVTVGRPKS